MELHKLLAEWSALWGVPELACRVEFSPRLRASLGRCLPRRALIRLHPDLEGRWREHFQEVLCHEFAHLAVEHLYPGARAHGPEWASLVRQAGFVPRRRMALDLPAPGPRRMYLHRCPVCQATRPARTSARRFKCARCLVVMVVE